MDFTLQIQFHSQNPILISKAFHNEEDSAHLNAHWTYVQQDGR